MKAIPPRAEDNPQTKTQTMLLSLYGPMKSEIERFEATMRRVRSQGDSPVADALQEWRNRGAIAKLLQGVLVEGVRLAGKGKATNTGGKSFKGGQSSGKGSGWTREGPYGKGPRSPKGRTCEAELPQRQVSQTASVAQTSSVGRESSASSNLAWHPTLSSSTSSARRTHESSSPVSNWQ